MARKAASGRKSAIATLGSHCALQVLKGAKDEGFRTILVSERKRLGLYRRFPFIDEIIEVDIFSEILGSSCQKRLKRENAVLIPHGTLIAQMSSDQIEKIDTPIFGNKWILRWEADREMKEKLMREAGLRTPQAISEYPPLRANKARISGEVRVVEIENHDVAACALEHAGNLRECEFFLARTTFALS